MYHENTELRLKIEFEDGSSIRGVDTSILDEADTKLVKFIHFSLLNYSIKKGMSIYISTISGAYEVESKDRNWVDAKFSQLEEIFKVTPNQNYWLSNIKTQSVISNLLGITLGTILYWFFFKEVILKNDSSSFPVLLFSLITGQIIAYLLVGRLLDKLYPVIDFDTTLEHINENKKKKNVIRRILLIVIIPLIVGYLSNSMFK